MSTIDVFNWSAVAARRLARVEQVRALAPFPDRHKGDHWALNRRAPLARNLVSAPRGEVWEGSNEQNITVSLRGAPSTTATKSIRVPFAFVVREIQWAIIAGTAGGTQSFDVSVSGQGSVWNDTTETPQLLTGTNANDWNYEYDPRRIVTEIGATITLTLVFGAAADGHASVRLQPLAQFLRAR